MALHRDKKVEVIDQVSDLLSSSKLTVIAKYDGTSVKSMQSLRKQSAASGTKVRVVKNRLFKRALEADSRFSAIVLEDLTGQLLYAFNAEDEVAPAQNLAIFAKTEPQLTFVAGIGADGTLFSAVELMTLANLPSKNQLKVQLAGTIAAPLSGFVNVVAGNIRGVLNVLNARADQVN